jgi:hypothetical protein
MNNSIVNSGYFKPVENPKSQSIAVRITPEFKKKLIEKYPNYADLVRAFLEEKLKED